VKTRVIVRFTAEGFHYWPGARPPRAYLGQRHRHLFHVEVSVSVGGHDREIELHDLLEYSRIMWPEFRELGPKSCEMLAADLAANVCARWPGREVRVSVFEDGEVGAEVILEAPCTGS
jgi:hypothetical protein